MKGKNKQNKFLYIILAKISRLIFKFYFKLEVEIKDELQYDKPKLFVCNHPSYLDGFLAASALYPQKVVPVVSSYFFLDKRLSFFLNQLNAISKQQMINDVAAIRKIKKVIDSNGSILIYPEGTASEDGLNTKINEAIGKLAKFCKVDVYGIKIYGSFLAKPKFAPNYRKTKIKVVVEKLLTSQEVEEKDSSHLATQIISYLSYNENIYQLEEKVEIKSNRICEGIENIFFICPNCLKEHQIKGKGNKILCLNCQETGEIDRFGRVKFGNSKINSVNDWILFQKEQIAEKLKIDPYHESDCDIYCPNDHNIIYDKVGSGKVYVNENGIGYLGEMNDENVDLFYTYEQVEKLLIVLDDNFEIPNSQKVIAIKPKNKKEIYKYKLMFEQLKERRKN